MATKTPSRRKHKPKGVRDGEPKGDFIQVPRSLIYAGRYLEPDHPLTNPRYRMLLLGIWARCYKATPTRAYWEDLGRDLGVKSGAVRKWGYALEKAGLLRIRRHKGPVRSKENGRPGRRDERNTFDLKPLWRFIAEELDPPRDEARERSKASRGSDAGGVS